MSPDTATDTPEGADTEEAETEAVEVDEALEARLATLSNALGDILIESHIEVGRGLWIRVNGAEWGTVADIVRNQVGLRYFGFLSVIDWLPSPFGRSMDSEVDNVLERAATAVAGAEDAPEDTGDAAGRTEMRHGVTGGETRFQVFARVDHIGEQGNYWGVTIKADVPDDTLTVDTWTNVYAGADWHEREAWEMFGITFDGHPGLRNIYLPTDFEGNPLRKDFPLLARMVKPWPGIVDVEPLPDEGEPDEAASGDAGAEDAGADAGGEA